MILSYDVWHKPVFRQVTFFCYLFVCFSSVLEECYSLSHYVISSIHSNCAIVFFHHILRAH